MKTNACGDVSVRRSTCVWQGHVTCIRQLARCIDGWLTWTDITRRFSIRSRALIQRDLVPIHHRVSWRTCHRLSRPGAAKVRWSPSATREADRPAEIVVGIINMMRQCVRREIDDVCGPAGARGSIHNPLYLTRDCSRNSDRPETYCARAVERATGCVEYSHVLSDNVTTSGVIQNYLYSSKCTKATLFQTFFFLSKVYMCEKNINFEDF